MTEWFQEHQALAWWLGSFSVVSFVGTLLLIPVLVVRIPEDYFLPRTVPSGRWRQEHPLVRLLLLVLKNLAGVVLVIAGLAMLLLPGQGLLTVLVGLLLLNFPGKRALERKLVCMPRVHGAINWLRRRAGRSPLNLPC